MNVEKLTQNAQSAIMECQNIAISEGHQMLEVEHLHLALLMQSDGLIPKLLKNMGVEPTTLIGELQAEIEKLPRVSGNADNIYASRRLNQVLINAEKEAQRQKARRDAESESKKSSVIDIKKEGGRIYG